MLSANSYQISSYGWFQPFSFPLFAEVMIDLANNEFYNTRHIDLDDDFKTAAIARYHGIYYGAEADIGYAFVKERHYYAAPMIKIRATRLNLDPYVEEGAQGLNLSVSGQSLNQFTLGAGLRLADREGNLIPEASFMVLHDFVNTKQAVVSTFLGCGDAFPTAGLSPPKTLYQFALGISTISEENYKITLRYAFDVRKGFQANAGYVQCYYILG